MTARKDFSQVAFDVVRQATHEQPKNVPPAPAPKQTGKQAGGLMGGASRATKLSPERRAEIARKAAAARWGKS